MDGAANRPDVSPAHPRGKGSGQRCLGVGGLRWAPSTLGTGLGGASRLVLGVGAESHTSQDHPLPLTRPRGIFPAPRTCLSLQRDQPWAGVDPCGAWVLLSICCAQRTSPKTGHRSANGTCSQPQPHCPCPGWGEAKYRSAACAHAPNPAAAPISAGAPCSEPSTFLLTITASMLRGVLSSRDTPSLQHPCPAVSGRPVPYGGAGGERQAMDSGTWDQGSGPEHQPQGLWAPSLWPGPGASALGSRHCPAFWKKAGEGHGGCWARCPPTAGVLVQQAWGASPHLCLCPGGPSPA